MTQEDIRIRNRYNLLAMAWFILQRPVPSFESMTATEIDNAMHELHTERARHDR